MSFSTPSRHPTATAHAVPAPVPPADADSPLLAGAENRVRTLALLLLRLSADIALLRILLLALLAPFARRRPIRGPWYLSAASHDSIDAMSPRARRAARRLLAFVGWALAGHRRRGMRPHARRTGGSTPGLRRIAGPRAPPCPG